MWKKLYSKGRFVVGLSPMDGVTDAAFRYMAAKHGKPDMIFTEFVSVDALHFAKGSKREKLLEVFIHSDIERPIVAQVFGHTPAYFAEAAKLVEQYGFDGIDLNMGCPARNVAEQGSGAGLIRTPELAKEIIAVTKAATKLPVSVKTRIGVDKDIAEEWMETLMEAKPENVSLHGRTLKQLYTGRADWEAIRRAAAVVHRHGGHILGNGDVQTVAEAKEKCQHYGVDGVLIGRAAEGNPAVFAGNDQPTKEERLSWALEHTRLHVKLYGPDYFLPLRKHLAWYAHGFPGAGELRQQLVLTKTLAEVEEIVAKAV